MAGGDVIQKIEADDSGHAAAFARAENRLKNFDKTAHGVGKGSSIGARATGDVIDIATSTRGAVMRVNALAHITNNLAASAGVVAIGALATQWVAAAEAAVKYREELTKIDHAANAGNSAFKTAGGITQTLDEAQKKLDEMFEARAGGGTAVGKVSVLLRRLGNMALGEGTPGEQAEQEGKDREQMRKNAAKSLEDLAQKQVDLNTVESERLYISDRQADFDKEAIEHRERLAKIAEQEARAGVPLGGGPAAENERYRLAKDAIARSQALGDETLGINQQAAYGLISPGEARLRKLGAKRGLSSDRDAKEIDVDIFNERFQQSQIDNSEGGYNFAFHAAERKMKRERMAFAGRESDREGRKSRGAFGDSSSEGQSGGASLDSAAQALKSAADALKAAVTNQ